MPIVLIGISVSVFFMFTDPFYKEVEALKMKVASYNDALNNSTMLENERDKLTAKFGTINPDNLTKLQKLLPENIDNIRLILEIEKIASPYNMVLTDVRYNTTDKSVVAANVSETQGGAIAKGAVKNYEIFDLAFSTTGSYNNFITFLKDLESNLRIVDISSIDFSSDVSTSASNSLKAASSEIYKYNFNIRTYWLKN